MDFLDGQPLIPSIKTKACVVKLRTLAHICTDKQINYKGKL